MTAEIAIMNREAVALAADSAVTITQGGAPKIFASANKLFALSRHYPVGVMVYGNASFMEVPWDTVIKFYRARLGDTALANIQEYAENFIRFLETESILAPESSQEMYVRYIMAEYYKGMVRQIQNRITERLQPETLPTSDELQQLFRTVESNTIGEHYQTWRDAKYAKNMDSTAADALRKQYRTIIRETKELRFGSSLTPNASGQLTRLSGWILSKYAHNGLLAGESGIVIAGFGEQQLFPSVRSFRVSGVATGKLKYQFDSKSADIGVEMGSTIIPFAQDEMVRSFMEGIEPEYWIDILGSVTRLLEDYPIALINSIQGVNDQERERLKLSVRKASKEAFEAFSKEFSGIKATRYVDPVVSTIESMPKSELPAVAEALVNLQSFKRRVSGEQETVGGPIDVMLISKGDGLIWIQRKHYFDRDLNPQYFQAVSRDEGNGTVGARDAQGRRQADDRPTDGATG